MTHKFWYSAKMANVTAPHRCFVTIDGKEHEYTEWTSRSAKPTGNWDDYVLVGELEDTKGKIRIENAPEFEYGFKGIR